MLRWLAGRAGKGVINQKIMLVPLAAIFPPSSGLSVAFIFCVYTQGVK